MVVFRALVLNVVLILSGCSQGQNQTLVFGRGGDSVGLDPALEVDGESFKVADNIYDTLVRFKEESTVLEPSLAESWTASEDRLTWTFNLRSGVMFHDGTVCDADAIVFSLARQFKSDHPFNKVEGA